MNIEKIFYIIISTILVAIFIVFTFVFSLNSLDSGSKSKVKTIYYVDHISPAHQKVIDLFNEKYKAAIKVETIDLSFEKFSTNERKELLARYLRSKNDRIDIFSVDQIWVPRFTKWAVPLQNLLDSAEISTIIPNALSTCYYNNSLVAVPLYIDIAVMFYRADIINKLPDHNKVSDKISNSITWEDLINLHNRYAFIKNPFYVFQADDYEGLICAFTELMANQNNPVVDENGKVHVDSPEGRKALGLLVNLVNTYGISPREVIYFKENESFRYYLKNNGIFLRAWSSMIDDQVQNSPPEINANLKMAPMPHFRNTRPSSVYGGWNLMVSEFSEKIPEVMVFAKFLLSEESQKIMYEEGGYLPVNKKVYEDSQYVSRHKDLLFFKNLYNTGVYRPFMEDYTNVSDVLSYYINQAIAGNISVDAALKEAEYKIAQKEILVK